MVMMLAADGLGADIECALVILERALPAFPIVRASLLQGERTAAVGAHLLRDERIRTDEVALKLGVLLRVSGRREGVTLPWGRRVVHRVSFFDVQLPAGSPGVDILNR